MDISTLYTADLHEEGAEVQLKNPATGEKLDCFITIKGLDSKTFRKASRKKQRAMLAAMASGEETDEDALDVEALVDATVNWRGFTDGGKDYEFTPERAKKLYSQSPGIRQQLDSFLSNRRNFTKG